MERSTFWQVLGLDEPTGALYRSLVGLGRASEIDLTIQTGLAAAEVRRIVVDLEARRLIRRVDQQYEPTDPRVALTSLAKERRAVLDHAEAVADELSTLLAATRVAPTPYQAFELLQGAPQVLTGIADVLLKAEQEVDGTVAPPFVDGDHDDVHLAERTLLARGVRFRSIYDDQALLLPSQMRRIEELVLAGEEARVRRGLSVKILLVDRRTAILPLAPRAGASEPAALRLGPSTLLDALQTLFELLWSQAAPLAFGAPRGHGGLTPALLRVQQLLATGLSDTAVAATLGISERTFRRRLTELADHYGAQNRFQLGQYSAQRGTE